ncbi:DNase I-like protein [Cenococcum geophilum 1.58]|uniref:DNase I-like protein n=1 Tax=Cenococcum geophilum 1.58 TaxID=794803 RepID=A0ACC8ELI7_9PEZI|nr:DNase I-like protein [Cenococcum geophilum 1.58]
MPSSNGGNGSVDLLDSKIPGAFPGAPSSAISTRQTLSQAVYARRSEYTRPRKIRIKVGTWNVAALKGTEKDIGGWFVEGKGIEEAMTGLTLSSTGKNDPSERESIEDQEARKSKKESTIPKNDSGSVPGGEDIGIYALGLQEIVDINSPAEALRPYTDPSPSNRFKAAIQEALPPGYELIAEQQLIGLLLLVYISPRFVSEIESISTTSVGTGVMGVMGNKGAVTARLVLGETTRLVFINSHLAAGADKAALDRRNWDASQITNRTKFDPIVDSMGTSQASGEALGQEDFAFWFGDLNYRLEGMSGDDVRHLLMLHTRGEYGTAGQPVSSSEKGGSEEFQNSSAPRSCSSASSATDKSSNYHSQHSTVTKDTSIDSIPMLAHLDPTSLHTTLSSLLSHDELYQQQKTRKAFHDGWREGPLEFLPTYKYDIGSVGAFDSSEKKRCPSWCDRILYRTRRDKLAYDTKVIEEEAAKKKDEEMKARGMEEAGADEDVLFDYNPETDGDDYDEYLDSEPEIIVTKEGFQDEIFLEYYTAHQRVISSDHKPLDAVFVLKYDAVVPDLKARVHQEVVRELDRAENEGRPTITLIVDHSIGTNGSESVDSDVANLEGVDFGDVRFATSKRRSVTIANTGRVQATIGFVDRPAAKRQPGPTPPWLSIIFDREPDVSIGAFNGHKQYTIEPGEVCNAELKLLVDAIDIVRDLNNDATGLEDILVLRVENGRDHFLPVRGRWLQSSFGRSIDKLIRIPEGGIRRLQRQKPTGDDQGVMWSAPRELFRLTESVEDLVERTLAEWDMTSSGNDRPPWKNNAGWPFAEGSWYITSSATRDALRPMIYEALDCDQPFESAFDVKTVPMQRLETLAGTLIVFLRSLEDGIITGGLWEKLESGMVARERAKRQLSLEDERTWVLEILSSAPNHNISFILLTSMLSRIAVEIANSTKPSRTPRSSVELPTSPKVSVRRKTLSQIPEVARMQLINKNFAAIFSEEMIKVPELEKGKEKEKRLREERMMRVIEIFLSDGGSGPGG